MDELFNDVSNFDKKTSFLRLKGIVSNEQIQLEFKDIANEFEVMMDRFQNIINELIKL